MLGNFYRIFWDTGTSDDVTEEVGTELRRSWEQLCNSPESQKRPAWTVNFTDVYGACVYADLRHVRGFTLSTPAARQAEHERADLFDREEKAFAPRDWT